MCHGWHQLSTKRVNAVLAVPEHVDTAVCEWMREHRQNSACVKRGGYRGEAPVLITTALVFFTVSLWLLSNRRQLFRQCHQKRRGGGVGGEASIENTFDGFFFSFCFFLFLQIHRELAEKLNYCSIECIDLVQLHPMELTVIAMTNKCVSDR